MTAYMQYQPEDSGGLTFRWHGGEYIDVGSIQSMDEDGIDGDDFHAYDVINVWDHATGKPRIPRALDAFQARCDEYVAAGEDEA